MTKHHPRRRSGVIHLPLTRPAAARLRRACHRAGVHTAASLNSLAAYLANPREVCTNISTTAALLHALAVHGVAHTIVNHGTLSLVLRSHG